MGQILRDAKHHHEKVEYYCKYDNESQAKWHLIKLSDCVSRSFKSKRQKNSLAQIQLMKQASQQLYDEAFGGI